MLLVCNTVQVSVGQFMREAVPLLIKSYFTSVGHYLYSGNIFAAGVELKTLRVHAGFCRCHFYFLISDLKSRCA